MGKKLEGTDFLVYWATSAIFFKVATDSLSSLAEKHQLHRGPEAQEVFQSWRGKSAF